MPEQTPSASLLESLRFTLLVGLPNVIQGLFSRRPRAVAVASLLDVDRRAVRLLGELRRRHGAGPLWVRVAGKRALLLLSVDGIREALGGSPDPFASDPEPKRRGMSHFQPDALTISRGEQWKNRRRFAEAVLDTGKPVHHLGDQILAKTQDEAAALLRQAGGASGGKLEWRPFNAAGRRLTRRIILGDAAADDERVTELLAEMMAKANRLPKQPSERLGAYGERIERYIAAAEPGSLVSLFGEAPSDAETKVSRQVTHWMFALGDTLPANAFRALALIASHPQQAATVEQELAAAGRDGVSTAAGVTNLRYLEATLQEAMRLWPTTTILARETTAETRLQGADVPAGTQVLLSNVFNHRDPSGHEFADRFAPEAWTEGDAAEDWSFNHLSHGPQGCPGAGLALFVGKGLLARLLEQRRVRLIEPRLNPDQPMPHMLDYFRLRFAVEPK